MEKGKEGRRREKGREEGREKKRKGILELTYSRDLGNILLCSKKHVHNQTLRFLLGNC